MTERIVRRERGRGKKVKNVGLFFACGDVVDGFGDGGDEEDFGEHGVDAFAEKIEVDKRDESASRILWPRSTVDGKRTTLRITRSAQRKRERGGGGQTPACHQGRSC